MLVAKLRSGDARAYTEIYDRYKAPLYAFLWKRLDDKEAVRDILQEVFLTIWEKRKQINYDTSLSGYLFTAVRNKLLDRIAHQKVQQKYIDSFHAFAQNTSISTDHLIRTKEINAHIDSVIAKLPPKTREVFELSRVQNFSRKEIAQHLDISEQTVKSHMFTALKTLKHKLNHFLSLLIL